MTSKEEIERLVVEVHKNIYTYENNIKLERERLGRIQDACTHEWTKWDHDDWDSRRNCPICKKWEVH